MKIRKRAILFNCLLLRCLLHVPFPSFNILIVPPPSLPHLFFLPVCHGNLSHLILQFKYLFDPPVLYLINTWPSNCPFTPTRGHWPPCYSDFGHVEFVKNETQAFPLLLFIFLLVIHTYVIQNITQIQDTALIYALSVVFVDCILCHI